MGEAEKVDLDKLKLGYEAVADKDWDRVQILYHEAIEWVDPPEIPDGGVHVGLEAVRESWSNYLEALEDWTVEPEEIVLSGDEILVRSRVTGTARIGGAPLDLELFQVWTARDGKLVRHRGFLDRRQALGAAGIEPD
jgi:ketosteroid isomerase-like protein